MKILRALISFVLFLLCGAAVSQAETASGGSATGSLDLRGETGVSFVQRTDGSKLVDVYYTLNGGTSSVALGVSLDGGTTFTSVKTLTGDVGAAVSAGTSKHIVWNAGTDFANLSAPNVKMRVTALLDGAGGSFAPIPGGTYSVGNLVGDSDLASVGTVAVTLSPYYMAVTPTTKAQWDAVRTWATSNGYTDLAAGSGKAANHPVHTVNWYEMVKWANAASEKEGLTPCYKSGAAVYRTGTISTVTCDWTSNGYRLPTEAEWEVAARGGLSGKRFTWGDSISQSQANYKASPSFAYDLSGAVNDYHPAYKSGAMPYTSPVGSFAANGYGLYDITGNLWHWCWDWYGATYSGGTDPRGPATGTYRITRGGEWYSGADNARCGKRSISTPTFTAYYNCLRLARGRPSDSGTGTVSLAGPVDTTPPVLTVPAGVVVNATSAAGAAVTLSGAVATDDIGTPALTYSPPSGSTFPVGTTTVTVTATDSVGNTATGTYTVTVVPQATNATFSQRTDGSKLVDVYYTLNGGTSSVALGVSLDGGTTFTSVNTFTGDVGAAVSAGTSKHIVWNAGTDYANLGAANVKMRVTALLDGAGGSFAPIPGGTYSMGNLVGDSDITDAGTVSVTLSPYYMAVNDTTKAQWDAVRTWAAGNGYTDLAVGGGKASNHPVQTVSWYDAVKWANAASEKEGLVPCYKTSGAVVRTGTVDAVTCDWSANGYRLPTEAEWEVAARGGLIGKRFPWGDTISHAQANYTAKPTEPYDLSGAVNDYHPAYKTGGMPYTSPAGSFAANGYGLYDMAGNVYQWCWDWYGTPYSGGADPRGPASGVTRTMRGGDWSLSSVISRSGARRDFTPSFQYFSFGFRLARGRSSGSGTGTVSLAGPVDTTPPMLTLPAGVVVNATSAAGASVTLGGASATDNFGTPTLTYSPASGSTFPVGTTTVTVAATDSVGNTATGSYTVTVVPQATNATFSQRTDGSKLVDVYYTLNGGTSSVALAVSLDGGTTFTSVNTLTGDVGAAVSAGTSKHIVWNAGTDYANLSAPNVKMRVTALLDGAGGSFAPIPGGTYSMGNLVGDSDITNAGTVSVTLSPYYMAVNDTTKAQWDAVRTWAAGNGYTDLAVGAGKASNHPVQTVSWYDAVKWANAASEKEGLIPCYNLSGAVVRTGTSNAVTCDWTANGYRLPTEAEWEIAARGGLNGKRFPWGDTTSQSLSNHYASSTVAYDLSGAVNNHHPTYAAGGMPYTSPVGSFVANGYGLYDMVGNIRQWCWDWYGTPYAGGVDPYGMPTGSGRVFRGGYWSGNASSARTAFRNLYPPTSADMNVGFRLARGRSSGAGTGTVSLAGPVDTTPPMLTVPASVFVNATSPAGALVVHSGASATDNLGTPALTYSPASGSTFPVGTTTVTVTATDSVGNTATGTYTVTVVPQATNATFSQRTDGSKLVDVYYTLNGGTSSVALGVSLDGGTTFTSVTTLTGDVGAAVSAGTSKHIVWNAGTDYANLGAANVKMRVTALLDGAGGSFAPIPGGTYSMGNLVGDADITDAGTVSVTLSPYYMSVNDTTKAQWDAVRTWAAGNGYTDLQAGEGVAPDHPVQMVNWYNVVKWANAASEKEGLTPCYRVAGAIFRQGTDDAVACDWSANGYRLPTEAEWEIAARGGLSGKRFPWGDTISHSQANYLASSSYAYDLSGALNDYHPDYKTVTEPYTSPVGSFAANGYGLYDMAGNVTQFCWDWYGVMYSGGSDPRGPSSGSKRVTRGGYWGIFDVGVSRTGRRNDRGTFDADWSSGFRLAKGRSSGAGTGTLSLAGAVDTTPPVLTVPGTLSVNATSASGAIVTLSGASATDNLGTPALTYSPASGSTFPVGTTTVTATATDSMGNTATGTFTVTVSAPVTITQQPAGGRFTPGTSASLSVGASGVGPFSYQWRKDGRAISGGTGAALALSGLSLRDAGSYDVVVSNVATSVTSSTAAVFVDLGCIRGANSNVVLDLPPALSTGVLTTAQIFAYPAYGQTPPVWGVSAVSNGTLGVNLKAITVSGNYFVRFTQVDGNGQSVSADSLPFGVTVHSWTEGAGSYESLLESASGEAPDGAVYRGLVSVTVSMTGAVSGRVQYVEAEPLPDEGGASTGRRAYNPVTRVFSGALSPRDGAPLSAVFSAALGSGSDAGRQEVGIELDYAANPVRFTARVRDTVSARPAVWTSLTSPTVAAALRLSSAVTPSGTVDLSDLPGLFNLASDAGAGDGKSGGYMLAQVAKSGRVLWISRFFGRNGSGSGLLNVQDAGAPAVSVYQWSTLRPAGLFNSSALIGRLNFERLLGGGWRMSAGSEVLGAAFERQSTYALRMAGVANGASAVYSAGLNAGDWNGVQHIGFGAGEGVLWRSAATNPAPYSVVRDSNGQVFRRYDAVSVMPDFFKGNGQARTMRLSLEDPEADRLGVRPAYAWNVSLSTGGQLKAEPVAGSGSPALTLKLDLWYGEITGVYVRNGVRRSLFGAAVPSAVDVSQSGRGWVEKGALPSVQGGVWLLK